MYFLGGVILTEMRSNDQTQLMIYLGMKSGNGKSVLFPKNYILRYQVSSQDNGKDFL